MPSRRRSGPSPIPVATVRPRRKRSTTIPRTVPAIAGEHDYGLGPHSKPTPTPRAEDLALLDKHDVMDLTAAIRALRSTLEQIEASAAARHFANTELTRELVHLCRETRLEVAALHEVLVPRNTNGNAEKTKSSADHIDGE